jgi:proline iminopeptidase
MNTFSASDRFDGLWWQGAGSGPLFLAMHGGLGFDHSYFRPALDALSAHLRVVYYDHRGNGRSDEPSDWRTVSHATWVEDAERLRQHLGAETMVLFGHSYGGLLAQEYALRYPERLAGLILCSTYPSFAHAAVAIGNAAARGTPEQLKALTSGLAGPVSDEETFVRSCRAILPLYFNRPTAAHVSSFDDVRFRVNAFNHAFFECLPTFSMAGRLGQIRVPTLVIGGDDDWIAPTAHGAALLHQGIPDSELAILTGAGHFPFVEEPDTFLRVITEWVSRTLAAHEARGRNALTLPAV